MTRPQSKRYGFLDESLSPSKDLPVRSLLATKDGRELRVIDRLDPGGAVVVYDTVSDKAQPRIFEAPDADENLRSGFWKPTKGRAGKPKASETQGTFNEIPEDADPRHVARWNMVEAFIRDPLLYDKRTRGAALARIAGEHGCTVEHVRAVFRLAWRGGMTFASVALQTELTGRRTPNGKPWGRPPTVVDYSLYAWPTAEFRNRVLAFAKTKYMKKTFDETYDAVLTRFFSEKTPEGPVRQLPPGRKPTERQVRSLLVSSLSDEEKSRRKGKLNHDLNFDQRVGTVHSDCKGPGDVYEIDASQVDVWLLSREDGEVREIIGKATMYLIVDRYSRLIVGFYCSLDAPSWTGALMAILSIFEDKKKLCERYGVKYVESEWMAHGLMPNRFFTDRGPEFTSFASDYLAKGLRVTVTHARALWAAAKGTVEVTHKLVNMHLKRDDIGWDPAYNTQIRRAAKTWKNAKLTLPQMRKHLLEAVLTHNRSAQKAYQLPPNDIRDGKKAIPLEIFARGLARYGRVSTFDEMEVLLSLLPRSDVTPPGKPVDKTQAYPGGASVTRDGVFFAGAMYTSKDILDKGWITRAKVNGAFHVNTRHNPGLVDFIYVFDPKDPKVYHRLELTRGFKAFSGYTRYELLNLVAVGKATDFWTHEDILAARVARYAAREESKAAGKGEKPKKVVKRDVAAARAKDKLEDRQENLALPASPFDTPNSTGASHEHAPHPPSPHSPAEPRPVLATKPNSPVAVAPPVKGAMYEAARLRLMKMRKPKS